VGETRGRNTFSHEIIYFFIRELKFKKISMDLRISNDYEYIYIYIYIFFFFYSGL
jgi:hypothetical protein